MQKLISIFICLLWFGAIPTKAHSETSGISEMLISLEILRDAGEKCVNEIKTQNTLGYSCKEHQDLMLSFMSNTKKLPKGSANEAFDKDPELENRYFSLAAEIDHSYSYVQQWMKMHPNQKYDIDYSALEQMIKNKK